MYAVGKVGSLFARSVYSVSGPFHPFGGAVDVVVVQQQDGSFKSSPWYVRFGKFQGVLKSREKVIDISVNGVEAGFHMYLDSNGEAYFLRNADPNSGEEGEFIVSPASSGDEREAPPVQEAQAQLRKSKSTSCDNSTMEADVGEGKNLVRTISRRTTILERMFGRKSVKNNADAVDRVSSLERAEIAAELLDTKWSTNLPRSSKPNGSNDEPSKSSLAEVSNNGQMETSKPNGSNDDPSKSNLAEVSSNDQMETSKPNGSNDDPSKSNLAEVSSNDQMETSKPNGSNDDPSKSNLAEVSSNDQMETSKSNGSNDDPSNSNLAEVSNNDQMETSKPPGSNDEPSKSNFPEVSHNDKMETSKPNGSNDDPSQNNLAEVSNNDQMETSKPVFSEHSLDHGKEMDSNCDNAHCNSCSPRGGRNISADETDQCLQATIVKKEVVEIHTRESSDFTDNITSITGQHGSESLSNDLGADKLTHQPVDTQDELLHDVEDVAGRETHTEEVEIHTRESSDFTDNITSIANQRGSESLSNDLGTDKLMHQSGDNQDELLHDVDDVVGRETHTEEVEMHTRESSDFTDNITSITHQHGSESLSNDLGTDKLMHQSVDTQDALPHDVEDVAGRETHTEEVISNGIFEIHVVETDITSGKSEVVSEIVTVDSDGANQNFTDTNYQNYGTTDISAERHEVSLIPSAQDAAVQEKIVILSSSETVEGSLDAVQEKVVILSSSETVESSDAVSCILDDTIHDASDISQPDSVQHEEHSTISDVSTEKLISEESSLECYGAPSSKKVLVNVAVKECEAFILDNPAPQILEENGTDMDVSTDSVSLSHADTAHDLACQHVSSGAVEAPSHEPDIGNEDVTKNSIVENEACSGELVVSVIETSMGDGLTECIAQPAVFSNKIEVEGSPTAVGFSSLVSVEVQNRKLEDDTKSSSVIGDEVGFALEATAKLDQEAEPAVSFSEYTEEIQFQFSDTENFADRKAMDDIVDKKTTGEVEHDESDCDTEKQAGGDLGLANDLENCSDSLQPVTSPVSIPAIDLQSGDSNIEAKSLPNLRSHIHDLERSDSFQLSCSLQSNAENNGVDPVKSTSNAENNGVDPVKSTNFAFLEQKSEVIGDSEENASPPEVTSNVAPDGKHADNLKVDAFIPFAELSLCRHLLSEGMGEDAACSAFDSEKITLEKFRDMKQSLMRNNKLVVRIAGRYFPWDAAAPIVLGMISFSEEQVFESKGMIKVERVEQSEAPGGSWRIWPFSFRRTSTISAIQPVCESTVETSVSTAKESAPVKELDRERNKSRVKRIERKVRSLTPTSEELASLDLREGRNIVTFTFSTAIVGKQQVECHIYLWKWNTRIVISDVDGTITKSDVLGQFMPLVGVDWSQNGVAHLFSAIKENGYQLLFLSARAISQAHITRQFLFNLKQDGKALPDGPVVISPDGLFPSLYREVIRRAPHEFKISCLETIKNLFPHDSNPFYAGFGNRDTDEISYLKVGIPMGKIFIINPKGEVAVNRRVDTKSYTSLHALVHGMFPPISSSSEQEDYNAWNYWKMPLPDVDL